MNFQDYLNEGSLSRLYKAYKEHDTGTITAFRSFTECNGEGDKITYEQNKKRNNILKNKLLARGYGVTLIKGAYIENFKTDNEVEVSEESYFVVDLQDKGTLEKDLISLGSTFDQDSITFSEKDGEYYLIGTNKTCSAYPEYLKKVKLEKPMFGANAEFHSKINGRPFIFERPARDEITALTDFTPTEIRSIKESAEKPFNFKEFLNSQITEETTSGDVASVPTAIGSVRRRVYPKLPKHVKEKPQRHHHAHF